MFSFFIFISFLSQAWNQQPLPIFRLSLFSEPASLSIFEQKTSSSAYLLSQIHSPLLWYDNQKLHSRLAHCEQIDSLKINCRFLGLAKFSNGELIRPIHFQKMVLDYLNPKNPGQRADLLLPILNAEKILSGKMKPTKLGIKINDVNLIILLEKPNSDFIYNLANPLLSPQFHSRSDFPKNPEQIIASGPYVVQKWEVKNKIQLTPNIYFPRTQTNPPSLEFQFISEDSVALNLYERGQLDFLRRLPTLYIPKYKSRQDFYFVDQFRFDYIGFGPTLQADQVLRRKLTTSLNYTELQNLFDSRPRPGCVGIPAHLYLRPLCYDFVKNEKSIIKKTSKKIEYLFSKQGGDDHQRAAEWIQSELKKNLDISIELKSLENKLFLQTLKKNPPSLFRKGLAPDRPTCLAVLENFLPNSQENFLRIHNKKISQLIQKMRAENSPEQMKAHCQKALDLLLAQNILIPTGPISFALLVRSEWKNWTLNELNQLDLSELTFQK